MFPQMSKTLVTRTSVNFYLHFEILCFVSLAGHAISKFEIILELVTSNF